MPASESRRDSRTVCGSCGHERMWHITPAGNEVDCDAPVGEDDSDETCPCPEFSDSREVPGMEPDLDPSWAEPPEERP